MLLKRIPEAELEIMRVLWVHENSISSIEITKIMENEKGWKKTTTLTLLSRLAEKHLINVNKGKKITYFSPVLTEKSYLGLETNNFLEKVHGGSLKSFITTLHQNNNITDEDIAELEEWIKNR